MGSRREIGYGPQVAPEAAAAAVAAESGGSGDGRWSLRAGSLASGPGAFARAAGPPDVPQRWVSAEPGSQRAPRRPQRRSAGSTSQKGGFPHAPRPGR